MLFDKNIIIKIFEHHFGIEKIKIIPICEGYFSNSYKVHCDNKDFYLRIAPPDDYLCLFYEKRMTLQEPELHKLILENTNIPVPEIIVHDSGRKLLDKDYVIMEFLPGKTLSERNNELNTEQFNRCLFQWGRHIRELHNIKKNLHGYIGAHKPMEPRENWPDAFGIMWEKIISDCLDTGCYTKDEASFAVKLYEKHMDSFLPKKDIKGSLMHMDLWVTNVLIDSKGNITGIIDFDRACWGDPEIEFSVLNYCGLAKDPFYKGYGSYPTKSYDSEIRFHFYTLYEHQKYIVISMSQRRNNPMGARQYADQSLDMMQRLL
jgi:aminoglycoside phosphotransferase (APT) family kinase protein